MEKLILKPVYLKNSNYEVGSLIFRRFQKKFIETKTHCNILITPTGSGKTLSVLAKLLLKTDSKKGIFIYPTNELIRDQLNSLKILISELGFRPLIISVESFEDFDLDTTNWQTQLFKKLNSNHHQVVLLAINGVSLYEFAEYAKKENSKGKIFSDLINIINTTKVPSILLTNIDTLYLVLKNKYKDNLRILNLIINWRHVVIDEFHLYTDISLVNLIYIITLYYLFIKRNLKEEYSISFLSATPSNTLNLIYESFKDDISIIHSKPFFFNSYGESKNKKYKDIRKQTEINFISKSSFLYNLDDLEFLYKIVDLIIKTPEFNSKETKNKNVRLLILLNTMIFTENFYKFLLNKFKEMNIKIPIARIHGLIPSVNRTRIDEMHGHILIGTRTIEIGVDFDVPFMIFEAFDEATFFQRLGRGGRHNPCVQYCITTPLLINSIQKFIEK
ncbi:MAG: type I-D CRISPR-associated helicase Cas3', partial [Promethearchaeota archaeon]